jgi:hypothetical protein
MEVSLRIAILGLAAAFGAVVPVAADDSPDAATMLTAPLLPEGTAWNDPRAYVIDGFGHPLLFDLRASRRIRAILLQADGNDVYFVETSGDLQSWRTIWRTPRYGGLPGLRTRSTLLPAAVEARFIRIRPTAGDGAFSVARLRIYDRLPSPWPPSLDDSGSRLPMFPFLSPEIVEQLRHAIGGLALMLLTWRVARGSLSGRVLRVWRSLLGAAALLAALSFSNFLNFHYYLGAVHLWDAYHYYVGAKYFPEIGYTGLYECSALAEADDGGADALRSRRMRDLSNNQLVPAESVLDHPERCRRAFSPGRWDGFRSDVRFFRNAMGEPAWSQSQTDHGFNATPAWILAGMALAGPTRASRGTVAALASLDVLVMVAAWLLIGWAFGFEAACVATLFFGLDAFARFAWTGGGFLRYDWLFWAVAGACFLRRGRDGTAGFALAYSAALRVFPALLIAGVGVGAIAEGLRTRRFGHELGRYRRFAAGVAVATIVLGTLSVTATGRPRAWSEFRDNTRRFLSTQAENFVGLPVLASYRPSLRQEMLVDPTQPDPMSNWARTQAALQSRMIPGVAAASLLYLLLLVKASRRVPAWAQAVLGMGFAAIALRMANYYYSWLTLFALLWELSPATGLALTSLAWASNLAADAWPAHYDQRAAAFSALAVAFVLGTVIRFAAGAAPAGPTTESEGVVN